MGGEREGSPSVRNGVFGGILRFDGYEDPYQQANEFLRTGIFLFLGGREGKKREEKK